MGANTSSTLESTDNNGSYNYQSKKIIRSGPVFQNNASSHIAKAPRSVIEFHSSARWKAHFDASKGTAKLIVVDFTATWCGPCRLMEPVINDLVAKYADVEFIKIDVDELDDVARSFGVQAMPTFLMIKNGKVVDNVVGAKKDELQKKIELHHY